MTLYLDASAAVSIFITEDRSPRVIDLISGAGQDIVISDLTAGEFCAAVSTAVRMKRQTETEGRQAIADFDIWYASGIRQIAMSARDIEIAIGYVRRFELGLLFPDALHLAMCRRVGGTLVTGDKRQAGAAEALAIPLVRV